jgi:hypothetical protein
MRGLSNYVIFMVALLPLAYTNYLLFGSPVVTGYQRTAVAGHESDQVLSIDHTDKFNQPLVKGAYQLLFHRYYGVIPTNPIIILGFLGVIWIRRIEDRAKIYLILTICFIQFIFFAKYDEWDMSRMALS